jgi:hypothetical protein
MVEFEMKTLGLTLLLFLAGCSSTKTQKPGSATTLTLDHARQVLNYPTPGGMLDAVDLNALNFSRELEIGGGFRIIVISTDLGGGLILFTPKGLAENSIPTQEITWLQLFDLNDDGISELATEESEGHATDILVKNFKLYKFDPSGIKKIWEDRSYIEEARYEPAHPTQSHVHEEQYFLRFDSGGGGSPTRMTYLAPANQPGQFRNREYVMTGDTIREISEKRGIVALRTTATFSAQSSEKRWSAPIRSTDGRTAYVLSLEPDYDAGHHVVLLELVLHRPGDKSDAPNLLAPTRRWHGLQRFHLNADDLAQGAQKSVFGARRTFTLKELGIVVRLAVLKATVSPISSRNYQLDALDLQIEVVNPNL